MLGNYGQDEYGLNILHVITPFQSIKKVLQFSNQQQPTLKKNNAH